MLVQHIKDQLNAQRYLWQNDILARKRSLPSRPQKYPFKTIPRVTLELVSSAI